MAISPNDKIANKHMKMSIKSTMCYCLLTGLLLKNQKTARAGEDVEQLEFLGTAGSDVKWETEGRFLNEINMGSSTPTSGR